MLGGTTYTPDYLSSGNGLGLVEQTNKTLQQALDLSISEEADPNFTAAMQQNVFKFSGFKTNQELREVSALLTDEQGNLRPFDQFKQDVLALNDKYNLNYLQAEYNMAVQSAQMASKWQDFEAHKDFVNLQYRTAGDEKVREEHRALNGTTLPVEDPFWKEYLPPLGWNCRCTVVEVAKEGHPVSNSEESMRIGEAATKQPSQQIFRFNPGQTLQVFPPRHPYYKTPAKAEVSDAINKAGYTWAGGQALKRFNTERNAKPTNGPFDIVNFSKPVVEQEVQRIPRATTDSGTAFDQALLLTHIDKLMSSARYFEKIGSKHFFKVDFLGSEYIITFDESGNFLGVELAEK